MVSRSFTAFDSWVDPLAAALCSPCGWAYTDSDLRTHPHLVTRAPSLTPVGLSAVAHQLREALPVDQALIVPLRPGRKHLLPEAAWGRLTTEDGQLTWTSTDATLLAAMVRLRVLGFGSRMLLTEPAPPWPVLRRLDPARWASVLQDWRHLDGWRRRTPWLRLAAHLSAPTPTSTPPATNEPARGHQEMP